jgi:lambda repressor-like predicted transcriptional regulator
MPDTIRESVLAELARTGMSQAELARRSGCWTARELNRYLNTEYGATARRAEALLRALGLTICQGPACGACSGQGTIYGHYCPKCDTLFAFCKDIPRKDCHKCGTGLADVTCPICKGSGRRKEAPADAEAPH